jgi:hypothetical protein
MYPNRFILRLRLWLATGLLGILLATAVLAAGSHQAQANIAAWVTPTPTAVPGPSGWTDPIGG